jgi:hypothetical protein
MGLELTPRDHALLWSTWQNRFMTPRQYLRRFWSDATHQAASKRLTHLKNEGLLQCAHFPWAVDRNIYTITAAGNRALIEAGLLAPAQARDFSQRPQEMTKAIVDALGVVDLRIAFELTGAGGDTWVSDHQLRQARRWHRGNTRVADGMFDFDAHGRQGRGVLEIERRSYGRRTLARILSRLRYDHGGDTIFFVALSADRARRIWRWAMESQIWGDKPGRFLVAPFKAVLKHGLDAGFVDLERRVFEQPHSPSASPQSVGDKHLL